MPGVFTYALQSTVLWWQSGFAHMISKVEEIERERLAAHFSIDATKQSEEPTKIEIK